MIMNKIAKTTLSLVWAAATGLVFGNVAFGANNLVPFQGQYSSDITFTSPYTATLVGSGLASHLGRASNNGDLHIVGPAACEGGFSVENTDTLTAANGDQLVILITQQSCPVGDGVYQGSGTWSVLNGTGRFMGASGAGSFSGLGDFNTGKVTCTLSGMISSPS